MERFYTLAILLLSSFFGFSQTLLPPAAPSELKAAQIELENRIKVDWKAPVPDSTFAGYKLYYKPQGATWANADSIKLLKVITQNITVLLTDTTYNLRMRSYRVTAGDTIYSAAYSNVANALVVKLVKPTAYVETSSITRNSFMIYIRDTNKNENGFVAEIYESGLSREETISDSGTVILRTLGSFKPNTTYRVRVCATRNGVKGPWSEYFYGTTLVDLPAQATLREVQNCPFETKLAWTISTRIDEIDEIQVLRSTDNVSFSLLHYSTGGLREFTDPNALPGLTYYYRILTKNVSGSTNSNTATVHVASYTAPRQPTTFAFVESYKTPYRLQVQWTHGEEDTKCKTNILAATELAININGQGLKGLGTYPNWITTANIEDLQPNDEVEVYIRTISDKDHISDWKIIKDSTPGPAAAPSNLFGVVFTNPLGNTAIGISWKSNSNATDYYEVEKSEDGENYYKIGTIRQEYVSFNDYNVKEGYSYWYRVRSGNWVGYSAYSNAIGPFNLNYTKVPNDPFGLVLKINGSSVDITWRDNSIQEQKYVVEKSTDGGTTFVQIAETDKEVTFFKDNNVDPGKRYMYRVKATNTKGSSGYTDVKEILFPTDGSGLIINVYPNPTIDAISLKSESINGKFKVQWLDQSNRQIRTDNIELVDGKDANLSVQSLPPGIYNLVISNGKDSFSKKIVKL